MVANAEACTPSCTERLPGNTAAAGRDVAAPALTTITVDTAELSSLSLSLELPAAVTALVIVPVAVGVTGTVRLTCALPPTLPSEQVT